MVVCRTPALLWITALLGALDCYSRTIEFKQRTPSDVTLLENNGSSNSVLLLSTSSAKVPFALKSAVKRRQVSEVGNVMDVRVRVVLVLWCGVALMVLVAVYCSG